MKSLSVVCIVILLAICLPSSFCALARGNFNVPKNPGKCTISENLILSNGDSIKDPNQACGKINCYENGDAVFETCGVENYEGCTQGDYVDKSLPYPACCKRHLKCN